MALPKKRTSKSRTKRRFSQYVYNQKKKLERVVDRLKHIDAPIIFDSSTVKEAPTNKRVIKVDDDKKSKVKVEKVEKIDVKKAVSVKKEEKKSTNAKTTEKVEKKVDKKDDKDKTEEKGKWFGNLFHNKGKSGGGSTKDFGNKSQKKMFRRKSI